MRKLCGILAVGAMLVAGGTATAAPVVTTATLSIDLGALGGFALTGTGTVSIVGTGNIGNTASTITGSQIIVPNGLLNLTSTLAIPVTPGQSTLVSSVILKPGLGNGAGSFVSVFTPTAAEQCPVAQGDACVVGGGKGGLMPIVGTVTAVLAGGIKAPVPLGAFGIGVGGGGAAGLLAGFGAPWTTGQGQVVTTTTTAVSTGDPNAPLTFVTPVFVSALGAALPIFAKFSLSGIEMKVPEPGTILLLASGLAGLLVASRRRS